VEGSTTICVELVGVSVQACVGVGDEERAVPQELRLEASVWLPGPIGDALGRTFDYGVLDRLVPAALAPAPRLLETIAERLVAGIAGEVVSLSVKAIEVTVTKVHPPLALPGATARVRLRWEP
jgi:dihydroneopterin aldolase